MNTHDVLALAVAQEAIRRVASGATPWSSVLSPTSYITASRSWPVPDFVLVDPTSHVTIGAEFKPPKQTKREYLTGLGQAVAYARDFHYGVLVVPRIADDGYPIAQHIASILAEPSFAEIPVGLLTYDPSILSPSSPGFDEVRFASARSVAPVTPVALDTSIFAKWREMSPEEAFLLLSHSYDEQRTPPLHPGTIRDRAFDCLWSDIQSGSVHHWSGGIRNYSNTPKNKVAVSKNYRNFLFHIGWAGSEGSLTKEGLEALHTGTLYGSNSQPFKDEIARALLLEGKHLIFLNAISEFQNGLSPVPDEKTWLNLLEDDLENKGLLKRNPARHAAAIAMSSRGFLKAEKQLWRNLGLIVPRGKRVFHPGRGFIFDWARITSLLQNEQ